MKDEYRNIYVYIRYINVYYRNKSGGQGLAWFTVRGHTVHGSHVTGAPPSVLVLTDVIYE